MPQLRPHGGATLQLILLCAASLTATGLTHAVDLPSSVGTSSTVTVGRKCFVDSVRVSGFMVSRGETFIPGGIDGYRVAAVLVQVGDTVTADQELIRLEPLTAGEGSAQPPPGAAGQTSRSPTSAGRPTLLLRAPAAGVVSQSVARVGGLANSRSEPLMRITTDPELDLLVDIPSAYMSRVRAGGLARVPRDEGPEFETTVRVAPTEIDPATQFGQSRIGMPSGSGRRPGMFASAFVDTDESCGLAVPRGAILRQNNATSVLVVKEGKLEVRRVELGLSSDDEVEIRSGLTESEDVVATATAAGAR